MYREWTANVNGSLPGGKDLKAGMAIAVLALGNG